MCQAWNGTRSFSQSWSSLIWHWPSRHNVTAAAISPSVFWKHFNGGFSIIQTSWVSLLWPASAKRWACIEMALWLMPRKEIHWVGWSWLFFNTIRGEPNTEGGWWSYACGCSVHSVNEQEPANRQGSSERAPRSIEEGRELRSCISWMCVRCLQISESAYVEGISKYASFKPVPRANMPEDLFHGIHFKLAFDRLRFSRLRSTMGWSLLSF